MFGWFTDGNRFSATTSLSSLGRRVGYGVARQMLRRPTKRRGRVVENWDVSHVSPPVEVQQTYAIVDGLGRPTAAAAILFSPHVRLSVQEGELMNVTLYTSEETARKMLASAKNSQDFHVVPYGRA
jgi:hypothetical protein